MTTKQATRQLLNPCYRFFLPKESVAELLTNSLPKFFFLKFFLPGLDFSDSSAHFSLLCILPYPVIPLFQYKNLNQTPIWWKKNSNKQPSKSILAEKKPENLRLFFLIFCQNLQILLKFNTKTCTKLPIGGKSNTQPSKS